MHGTRSVSASGWCDGECTNSVARKAVDMRHCCTSGGVGTVGGWASGGRAASRASSVACRRSSHGGKRPFTMSLRVLRGRLSTKSMSARRSTAMTEAEPGGLPPPHREAQTAHLHGLRTFGCPRGWAAWLAAGSLSQACRGRNVDQLVPTCPRIRTRLLRSRHGRHHLRQPTNFVLGG